MLRGDVGLAWAVSPPPAPAPLVFGVRGVVVPFSCL